MKGKKPLCPPSMGGSERTRRVTKRFAAGGKGCFQNPPTLGGRGAALVALALVPFLSGCPSRPSEPQNASLTPQTLNADRSAGAFAQTDPWILETRDPNASRGNHGIFIGNGQIGVGVGASGSPESLFLAGVYDAKETLQNFGSYLPKHYPLQSGATSYRQTLDMKRGVLTTQTDRGTLSVFASAVRPGVLVVNRVLPPGLTASPGNGGALVRANGHLVLCWRTEPDGSLTLYLAPLAPGQTPEAVLPASLSYEKLLASQEAAWQKIWKSADIQIDGDAEAQQLVHKLMFDLLQSTRPGMSESIAPESLSGDFYKGHIFWDAEIWMFPALLPQHPPYARTILDYRFKHLPEARAQAKKSGYQGADFPWESAASGNEVAPGGFSTGRHVTAGVGWATWQYYLATGDIKWLKERGWPLLSGVADYFASRAKKNAQTNKYDINGVFGPDELKGTVNNNTYTNAMAANVLRYAGRAAKIVNQKADPKWQIVADNLTLPFDKTKNVFLARDNDKNEKTKQADGELLLFPAELSMNARTAEATFDFHKTRPIKNGPAMTDSIHALAAARLSRASEAESYFRDSYRPFVRGPFSLFSEKRSLDRAVFTTGAGGVLESVLYGFGGLDFAQKSGMIDAPPALPASWKKLTITGIARNNKRYTLTVTPQKRTLTLMPSP